MKSLAQLRESMHKKLQLNHKRWHHAGVVALVALAVAFITNFIPFFGVSAGIDDDMRGYSWSQNYGWVSMNCMDDPAGCPVGGSAYGVDVDEQTGVFSGSAWSPNIGWISFQAFDVAGCPSGGSCVGTLNPTNGGPVSGYARVLSLATSAANGWVDLSGTTFDATTGYLSGYAWQGDDTDGDGVLDSGAGWMDMSNVYIDLTTWHDPTVTTTALPYAGCPADYSFTWSTQHLGAGAGGTGSVTCDLYAVADSGNTQTLIATYNGPSGTATFSPVDPSYDYYELFCSDLEETVSVQLDAPFCAPVNPYVSLNVNFSGNCGDTATLNWTATNFDDPVTCDVQMNGSTVGTYTSPTPFQHSVTITNGNTPATFDVTCSDTASNSASASSVVIPDCIGDPECSDSGVDNDGDGFADIDDLSCHRLCTVHPDNPLNSYLPWLDDESNVCQDEVLEGAEPPVIREQ